MKAVVLTESGGTDNLVIQEIPVPEPGPTEVLVKIHAISINPVDVKTRKGGTFYNKLKDDPPVILGWDISGVVESVGTDVNKFKEGDEVFGMVNFPGHGKAYAAYVAAPEAHLAIKPNNISHQEAAAATLAALTAWQVLVHEAHLKEGQHLLMHAAAGGVGHFAVQIARHLGAEVSGTASGHNAAFLKEIGVQEHIDYTREDVADQAGRYDLVFDPIGGDTTLKSFATLKPGGKLISIVGGVKEAHEQELAEKNISAQNYLVHSSGEDMESLSDLLAKGILKPHIFRSFSFEEIADAHRQVETGKTRGKVVVNVLSQA